MAQQNEKSAETPENCQTSPSETATTSSQSNNKRKAEWFNIDDDHNTYVYVSGLPVTLTEDDFIELMKKYGIIAKKPTMANPFNIKLYKGPEGSFKGDALCRYVRKESVDLALLHLDGYQYDDKHIIHCERAKFELKGSYDPTKKQRIDPKAKLKQKKTAEKLLSWGLKNPTEVVQTKVILKNMFTPKELANDASLILDIRDDIEEKCTELVAEPKRVDVYEAHPDGVIAVTFSEPEQAQVCVDALNGRYYAGRVVAAELWDGKTSYKIKETDEEAEKRLKRFEQDAQEADYDQDEDQAELEPRSGNQGDTGESDGGGSLDRESPETGTKDRPELHLL